MVFGGIGASVLLLLLKWARGSARGVYIRWRKVWIVKDRREPRSAAEWLVCGLLGFVLLAGPFVLMLLPARDRVLDGGAATHSAELQRSVWEATGVRLVDVTSGDGIPFVWLSVTQEGADVCEGPTNLDGELHCTLPAGRYDVSGRLSGLSFTTTAEIGDQSQMAEVEALRTDTSRRLR